MKTRMTVPEIDITILNPIMVSVLKDIARFIGVSEETYFVVNEDADIRKTRGVKGSLGEKGPNPLMGANDNLNCAMITTAFKRSFVEGYNSNMSIVTPSSRPIFQDEEIGFIAKPIYYKEKIDMGIELVHNSKTFLTSILNGIKSLASMPGLTMNHNPEYSYTLPHNLKVLLYNIFQCKKHIEKDLTFLDYFNSIASSNVTYRTSSTEKSGDDLTLAVKERQLECYGFIFEDILDTEIEVAEEHAGYKISFQYQFEIMMPTLVYLEYPILVYNQMLHPDLLKSIGTYERPLHTNTLYGDEGFYKLFMPGSGPYTYRIDPYHKVPKEDDFLPEKLPERYNRIFSILLIVDPEDPYLIMDLEDPDIPFKAPLMKFIKESEREYVGLLDRSLVHFHLYENSQLSKKVLYLNEKNQLYVKEPLDRKKIYRLTGYVLTDFSYLSSKDKNRIQDFINQDYRENFHYFKASLDKYGKQLYTSSTGMNPNQYQQYLLEVADVRNQFLSTLDMFIDYYQLDQEAVQKMMSRYQDPFSVLVQLKDQTSRHVKTKQISYITLCKNKG